MFNLSQILQTAAADAPDKPFVLEGDKVRTFAEIDADASRFASALATQGVGPGDPVALLLANTSLLPVCYYGALRAGAIPVALHGAIPAPELSHVLGDSGARLLVADAAFQETASAGCDGAPGEIPLVVGNLPEGADRAPGALDQQQLMASGDPGFATVDTDEGDTAALLYTAGTTGAPKGVVLTHGNFRYFTELVCRRFWEIRADDVMLMVAPPSHIFGQMNLNVACSATAGLSMLPAFTLKAFAGAFAGHKVTFFAGVPTLGQMMLKIPEPQRPVLGSLRKVMFGGTPMSPETMATIAELFGIEVITGYGLTEAVPLTFVSASMQPVPPGTVGRPAPETAVQIVGEDGAALPAGERGEILAKGPQVFREYHGAPEASAAAFADGWFRTGDVGYLDDEGFLFLVDRIKDMIKTSGYTVYPAEVENVLLEHPDVADAAVIGAPDELRGELVKAVLVARPEAAPDAGSVKSFCKERLAAYKCPREVVFVEALPRSPAGKILKKDLRG